MEASSPSQASFPWLAGHSPSCSLSPSVSPPSPNLMSERGSKLGRTISRCLRAAGLPGVAAGPGFPICNRPACFLPQDAWELAPQKVTSLSEGYLDQTSSGSTFRCKSLALLLGPGEQSSREAKVRGEGCELGLCC